MKTLLLADNQDITRAGLIYICSLEATFAEILEINNRRELVQALMRHPNAAIVLDYALSDLHGADDLLILQARFPGAVWLLFSEELSDDFIRRVLGSSEAFGLVFKDASGLEIRSALTALATGQCFIAPRIASMLQTAKTLRQDKAEDNAPRLTLTEKEILQAIARGKTTKEIAAERFSSIHTITTHRKNIFRKLSINNAQEAVRYALRAGMIDVADYYI